MEKILEARIHRLECLMKNEDMYDDDFDEVESDDFDENESDDFDEIDEDASYETGIKNKSIREMMKLLDDLAKQAKLSGKYNKLIDSQFYKTGKCLRSLDFFMKDVGL